MVKKMKHFPNLEVLEQYYQALDDSVMPSVCDGQLLVYNAINHVLDVYEYDSVRDIYQYVKN
jgi:hypothetical protein